MASIGEITRAHKGHTTGFDYLRLGLALLVVAYHCAAQYPPLITWWIQHRPLLFSILPMFFALSGFLVTGSLFRNTLPEFVALRAMRLVPALAFETALSALLLGPIFTTLPLDRYFAAPEFHVYFLNIVGDVHFLLPGVFDGEPVNSQLWTLPYELKCYLLLIALATVTLMPIKRFFALVVLIASIVLTVWGVYNPGPLSDFHPVGHSMVMAFLWGCVLLLYSERVPYNAVLAVAALLLGGYLLCLPRLEVLAAPPLAYLTVYIGLMRLPRIRFGDLSYGIFLYHVPVMQAVRFGTPITNPATLLVATVLLSGFCAFLSWTFIERPTLMRKNAILARLNRVVDLLTRRSRARLAPAQ